MPAIRSHSSLALNRDLNVWNHWDEEAIRQRGESLFKAAQQVWTGPTRSEAFMKTSSDITSPSSSTQSGLPDDGTKCEFTYGGEVFSGSIVNGKIVVDGISTPFSTFSGASRTITKTSRNGWNDWYLDFGNGHPVLADQWRKS
jgi:hypothetical protein